MRAIEFLTEYRNRMYQYIKSIVPTWPEYIVKDWLYANFARGEIEGPNWSFRNVGEDIPKVIEGQKLSVDTKWQLVPNMKFTMDMWIPEIVTKLTARAGGKANPDQVPRDAERHATQSQLAQQQGGVRKEPVILVKRPDGYDLLEGWHRTIQHFHKFPDGYTGPAYVAVEQGQQGVAEGSLNEFAPGEGGFGPFNVYVGNTFIDKFATFDQAKEEIEFLRTADPRSANDDWKIIDGTGKTVWQHDPGAAYDEYRMRHKIQFHKPDNKGVAEGVDDSTNLSGLQAVQSGRTALGLVNLPVLPSNNNLNTTAKVVNTGSRIVAVYKVQGVNIPFYISTGDGGKASVPPGKWYPVFGIHSSGWLNKGTEESINKFYGSKALARGAEILNKYLGDLRSVEDKIPLMKPDGYSIINKDLKPMGWHEVDSNVTKFKKRINAVLVQIGDAPHYPEVEYSKNDKKSQIVHLQNLAKFNPNITMKDFVNQGKEKIINDAMLEVNQLKNYYGQHKQADFVQLLSNLENDIDSFKRGSPANNNNQNSVPTLGLLLKGTLGKINFATP